MKKTVIGVDFGTLSARAAAFEIESGELTASAVFSYPHGCLDTCLPDGTPVGPGECYQDPRDYEKALAVLFRELFEKGVSPDGVIAVGTDFTFCTVMPVREDGTPLCCEENYRGRSQAYVKLWKHHGAQREADAVNKAARERNEPFLKWSGGTVSPEYLLPKIWETLRKDPEVFKEADLYLEAGDWITFRMTGSLVRNAGMAGHRGLWRNGYPSDDFLRSLDPGLVGINDTLLRGTVMPAGTLAGRVSREGAALTGLKEGTPVAVCQGDCYAAVPACGVTEPGTMAAVIGTSAVYMFLSETEREIPGSNGSVLGSMAEGFYGCESGQCCVGDHFAWYTDRLFPAAFAEEAEKRGISKFALLAEKASAVRPGESGLVALDWFNGTRSVLMDGELTGVMLGMSLQTKPEELYRALLEATAYGARTIVENIRSSGVRVDRITAAGGIAEKDPLAMRILSDVLGLPVEIAGAKECGALGSAVLALQAAKGIPYREAVRRLVGPSAKTFSPDKEASLIYDRLYPEYLILHDRFGRDPESPLKKILAIKKTAAGR